jgi:oxygen-independent coproporphyrinogen-3 oxidase
LSGIYLHIPFCKQACSYCDFYFVTRTSERDDFVKALIREIEGYRHTKFAEETVHTIYFGGGTPSLLKVAQVEQILEAIEGVFDTDLLEVTFEMNPDDVTKGFLANLKTLGISRASMGVQSFQPELLEFMHRAHTSEEALQCMELLSKSDFQSYTVDLIYGNPNETVAQLNKDLDKLLQFSPPHVSAYSLTVEPKTRLGKMVELNRITPAKDDTVAVQFDIINERLSEQGIKRYEVSNYARAGCEAVHNSSYWEHKNYLGFGPGAHSFWWGQQAVRWENVPDLRKYLQKKYHREEESLTMQQLAEERIMMGLRTQKGIGVEELTERYRYKLSGGQEQYLQKMEQEGKADFGDHITLTDKGIKVADAIILDLVTLH